MVRMREQRRVEIIRISLAVKISAAGIGFDVQMSEFLIPRMKLRLAGTANPPELLR